MPAFTAGLRAVTHKPLTLKFRSPRHSDIQHLIKKKMCLDLAHSVLDYPHHNNEVTASLFKTLEQLSMQPEKRFATGSWLPSGTCTSWSGRIPDEALTIIRHYGHIKISCCCTSTGELAALHYLKSVHGLNLEVHYQEGSSQEQIAEIVKNGAKYDFLVAGMFSYMYQEHPSIRKYLFLVPTHIDCQYLLVRGPNDDSMRQRLSKSGRIFFIPKSANEALASVAGTPASVMKKIQFADLFGLPGDIDAGDALLAWEPNAMAIAKRFGLTIVPDPIASVPVFLCANRRIVYARTSQKGGSLTKAFVTCMVAAMLHCQLTPEESLASLSLIPHMEEYFAAGASLIATFENLSDKKAAPGASP